MKSAQCLVGSITPFVTTGHMHRGVEGGSRQNPPRAITDTAESKHTASTYAYSSLEVAEFAASGNAIKRNSLPGWEEPGWLPFDFLHSCTHPRFRNAGISINYEGFMHVIFPTTIVFKIDIKARWDPHSSQDSADFKGEYEEKKQNMQVCLEYFVLRCTSSELISEQTGCGLNEN